MEKPIADPHSKIEYVKPTYEGSERRTQASRIKTPTNNVRRSTSTKSTVWFPRARIALKLGPINLMLYLVMLIAYAPFYTTVIETQVNDSRRKRYQKGKFQRMKNCVKNMANKVGSQIESRINNLKVNRTRRLKINKLRATAQRVNRPKRPGKHALYAMAALAMSSKLGAHAQQLATFDTDSKQIGVDNRCSACISHDVNDFV